MRVGVFQIGAADAPIRPQPRLVIRDYIPLHRFVAHKAFHRTIQMEGLESQLTSSLTAFSTWLGQIDCEGEADPRCLPFPVFSTKSDVSDLATPNGRTAFAQIHGRQSSRVDDNDLVVEQRTASRPGATANRWASPRPWVPLGCDKPSD